MTGDGSRLVRLVPRRAGDAPTGALPPEFVHLQELIEQFALEARAALEPQDRRLLDLHLGLFVLSGGPPLTLAQLATVLHIPATRLGKQQDAAARHLGTRLRLPAHGEILQAVRRAALAWSELLGHPSTTAVLDAFAAAGGSRPLLSLASIVLGGLSPRDLFDHDADQCERVVLRLLARRGPLPLEELSRAVAAVLPPEDVGERFDAALRIRLLAPVSRHADGTLALPEQVPGRLSATRRHHQRERRIEALIGALEELGTARVPQRLEALAVRLPVGDLPSAASSRALLRAEPAIFTHQGRGRYGLVEAAARARLLA